MSSELTPTKRGKIVGMHEAGVSIKQIAKRQKVRRSTVQDTLKRWREHGTNYSLARSGRPPALSSRDTRQLVRDIKDGPSQSWDVFAEHYDVGTSTIRKAANDEGFHKRVKRRKPFISAVNRAKRCQWAKNNVGRDWGRVIFTDESSIEIGESVRRELTIRRPGEEYDPAHVQTTFHSQRKSLMVWGAVAHGKKWPLVRLPLAPSTVSGGQRIRAEGLNGQRYADWIISSQLSPMMTELRSEGREDVLVVEDGAPAHSSKVAKAARLECGITPLQHPPSSPDLNPIEGLWLILKTKIGVLPRKATTLDELWAQVQVAWEEIDQGTVNRVVGSMETRRQAIQAVKGFQTRY